MFTLRHRLYLISLFVLALLTLIPSTMAQVPGELPEAPTNINVNPNQGRPTVTWTDNVFAEYYNIYLSTTDYRNVVLNAWYARGANAFGLPVVSCSGGVCSVTPDINPLGGTYLVWMTSWGNGGFATGGFDNIGWNSSDPFNIPTTPPGSPQVNVNTQSSIVGLTWTGAQGATWYQVWMGNAQYTETYHFSWHLASELGCENALICTLNPGDLLMDGSYEVWMQVYGPGGFSVASSDPWYLAAEFIVGDGGGDDGGDDGGDNDGDPGNAPSEIEAAVIAMLNAERESEGLGCLVHNDDLWEAARDHNIDMRDNHFWGHLGSNGSEFWERAAAAGYTGNATGENVAVDYHSAEAVYDAWITSEGHRNNMLNTDANEIGMSYVPGNSSSDRSTYWTMVLGRGNGVDDSCP